MYRLENCEYEHEGRLTVLITVTEMDAYRSMFVFWSIFLERGNVIMFVEGFVCGGKEKMQDNGFLFSKNTYLKRKIS